MVASYVAALLEPDYAQWNLGATNKPTSLTYTYLTKLPSIYTANMREANGFTAFTDAQKAAMAKIMASYSSVANLSFVEKAQTSTAASGVGQIALGNAYSTSMSGWGYGPGTTIGGDMWMSTAKTGWNAPIAGQRPYWVMMHEFGHTLGLKHPGDYDAAGGQELGPFLPLGQDNQQYTVMSYKSHPTMGAVKPQTLQLYDIAAVQHLYGANMSHMAGNDTYRLAGLNNYIACFWDAGGIDTFDLTGETRAATVDLNEGAFSSIGARGSNAAVNNISIAFGAKIENATGGNGNDRITGNALDNVLKGGAGDDILSGMGGNDSIDGGTGTDTALFRGRLADYALALDGTTLVLTSGVDGTDRVVNVERFTFTDGTWTFGDLAAKAGAPPVVPPVSPTPPASISGNLVTGTSAADKLYGTNGVDIFTGGAGNDLLYSAKDGQADIFVFGKASGADRIFNFEPGIDRLDLTAYGIDSLTDTALKLTQGSSGAVLDFGGGHKLVLNGIAVVDLVGSKMFIESQTDYVPA
ncbi:hypothetical protein HHL28_14140 [Aerophototrophica crusticola]|uniref:Peptidase metallopeptidase domain-containing protein n=1 Tax=Aerophototrophica crusticola TaxID=1709002 RepID=A0A858R8Y0_9PROT|nr:hypothetical protein HHL28_14140 [Rhodospirillaceae bacterium B3]